MSDLQRQLPQPDKREAAADGLERRDLLKHGLIWGGLAGAAGIATPAAALADDEARAARLLPPRRRRGLVLDVACLGPTFRFVPAPGGDPVEIVLGSGLNYGTSFLVEGNIYPARTIQGQGFDPENVSRTGHWLCRGWILGRSDRANPPVLTTQEYLLEVITDDDPYPSNQLASSGVEPGAVGDAAPRSLIGGTGKYAGARGQVVQRVIGTNTTSLPDGTPAPNFRFRFRFA